MIEQDGRVLATGKFEENDHSMFEGAATSPTFMSARAATTSVSPVAVASASVADGKACPFGHVWHRRPGHPDKVNVARLANLATVEKSC